MTTEIILLIASLFLSILAISFLTIIYKKQEQLRENLSHKIEEKTNNVLTESSNKINELNSQIKDNYNQLTNSIKESTDTLDSKINQNNSDIIINRNALSEFKKSNEELIQKSSKQFKQESDGIKNNIISELTELRNSLITLITKKSDEILKRNEEGSRKTDDNIKQIESHINTIDKFNHDFEIDTQKRSEENINKLKNITNDIQKLIDNILSNHEESKKHFNSINDYSEKLTGFMSKYKEDLSEFIDKNFDFQNSKIEEIKLEINNTKKEHYESSETILTNNLHFYNELKELIEYIQHSLIFSILGKDDTKRLSSDGKIEKFFTPGKLEKVIDKINHMVTEYEYSSDDNITSRVYKNDKLVTEIKLTSLGKPIQGKHYDDNGNLVESFKYDDLGQVINN